MEIERLPLGRSLADRHRDAELRWRGMPPGIPPEMAIQFMERLRAGSTVRKLTSGVKKFGPAIVSYERFKEHCELNPEWAAEAWRISKINAGIGKGAHFRDKTHCVNGHLLSEHGRAVIYKGLKKRECRACERMRYRRGHIIKPEVLEEVTARLINGSSMTAFTKAGKSGYLVRFSTLARYRREHPDFDNFLTDASRTNGKIVQARAQKLRWQRVRNAAVRDQTNDYYKIRAMLPPAFPDKDDVVNAIFEDLLIGSLKREDVKDRVQTYITAHNRMFPTKYAKFGDSPLVSLDEVMFEDGSRTRGDTVSRGLWD
jgi:hypothetical protein